MAGFPSDPQLTPTELTDPTTKIPAATGAGGAERRSVTPQQIINSANVGSATDTPDASGSLWARFLALMQDIGNYTASPDQSGTIKQRIRWLIDAVGNRVTVSTYNALRNAVGLASNNANIFGTTIWGRLNQVTLWLGNITSATFYYYQNFTATSLSSEAATARTIWVWLKRFSDSIKNLGDRLEAVLNDITAIKGTGYQSSTTLASLQQDVDNAGSGGGTTDQATLDRITALEGSVGESSDYNTGSGSLTGNIFERLRWLYEAVSARVTQATFNTLSNLVGGRPSLTYYYFATATASALSSANANTQAVWTWLSRLFTSIRNLDNKIALLKGVGYQSSTTLASLQQAVNSGGGGGGTPGANGLPGRQMGVFFRESATEPADPVVGEDTSGSYVKVATPSGWSTTRPANPTQKLWMLVQQGQGNVANDAFTETFSSGPIDISPGADGANGLAGRVWRFFFRRSATAIAAPSVTPYVTAGRVDIQTPSGWSTSIPAGSDTLRMLAQSTQPNAANDGGHHSLSFIIPLPQPASGGGGGTGSGVDEDTFNALANAVGARDDAPDIDGTTLWNQFNQVKAWLGSPSDPASATGSAFARSTQNAAGIAANTAAIAAIDPNAGGGSVSPINVSRAVANIANEDATQDQWSVGNIVYDNTKQQLNQVVGTPHPLDYTIRGTSYARTGGSNESLLDGHWVFGFTRSAIPGICGDINSGDTTLGEIDADLTGDLGDDIDAVLNVTNHSLSSGYVLVAMDVNASYVPTEIRIRTSAGTETVRHSLYLAETTATHKIYRTSQSDDLEYGDVFGISAEGAFTFDFGLSDASGANYLQGDVVKSFAPLPLSKFSRFNQGELWELPNINNGDAKAGDLFVDRARGDAWVCDMLPVVSGNSVLVQPVSKNGNDVGYTQETPGAISKLPTALAGLKTLAKDAAKNEMRVEFDSAAGIRDKVGLELYHNQNSSLYREIIVPLQPKPASDTNGLNVKYAGLNSLGTFGYSIPTITPATSGSLLGTTGGSVGERVGFKKNSYGSASDASLWKLGDEIYIKRWESGNNSLIDDTPIEADIRAESHAMVQACVVGQKLTFEVERTTVGEDEHVDLHYREPAANASAAINTPLGSRNAAHQCGIYELKLQFQSENFDSFIHLPFGTAAIGGESPVPANAKLAMFLKVPVAGDHNDFEVMNLSTDNYYILTYDRQIDDYDEGAGHYARSKWTLPSDAYTQLNTHLSASFDTTLFVGFAWITESGSGNDRQIASIIRSWIPLPYEEFFLDGVHLPMHIDKFEILEANTTRGRLNCRYKTNPYTSDQRERFFGNVATWRDRYVLKEGEAIAVNLMNREKIWHIPYYVNNLTALKFGLDKEFSFSSSVKVRSVAEPLRSASNVLTWNILSRGHHSYDEGVDIFNTSITPPVLNGFKFDYQLQEEVLYEDVNRKYVGIIQERGFFYKLPTSQRPAELTAAQRISKDISFGVDSTYLKGSLRLLEADVHEQNSGVNYFSFLSGRPIDTSSSNALPNTEVRYYKKFGGGRMIVEGITTDDLSLIKWQNKFMIYRFQHTGGWETGFNDVLDKGDIVSVLLFGGPLVNEAELVPMNLPTY